MPDHARRGYEYTFSAQPEALTIHFEDLKNDVTRALKSVKCWQTHMTEEQVKRERYCAR